MNITVLFHRNFVLSSTGLYVDYNIVYFHPIHTLWTKKMGLGRPHEMSGTVPYLKYVTAKYYDNNIYYSVLKNTPVVR